MGYDFTGKRVLVTGAGRGIGRVLAKRLAKCGAHVIALSRTKCHLDSLQSEVPSIETVSVDVGDWQATQDAVQAIGHVDMLVNNAALGGEGQSVGSITEDVFLRFFDVNVKGPLNITQIVSNKMKEKGTGGVIVNVSSVLAKMAHPNFAVYSAAKAALEQLTRVMAVELGPHKIRVNMVNPTLVNTEMVASLIKNEVAITEVLKGIPLGKYCEPDDVVDPIMYLLSDSASMIHGANLFIDGGQSVCL